MFMKEGQNYSAFVEGKWGKESALACGFVVSHVPLAGKGTACVSWMVSCHPYPANKSHPSWFINKENSTRFAKPLFETSRSCAMIPLLPSRAQPLLGASRPGAGAPLGLAGPSGAPRAPNSITAEKQQRAKLPVLLKAQSGCRLHRARSFRHRQVDAKYTAIICTHVASLQAAK